MLFRSGEDPIPGVSSALIAKDLDSATFNPSMVEVAQEVANFAQAGDVVITLGAGDVNALVPVIIENINAI